MGWVNPIEAVDTDEGRYHDRLDCLTEGRFEELVAKYGCRCFDMSEGGDRSVVAELRPRTGRAQLGGRPRKDSRKPRETRLSGRSLLTTFTEQEWIEHLEEEHATDRKPIEAVDRSLSTMFPIDRKAALRGFCE